jgi:hypothetical protein
MAQPTLVEEEVVAAGLLVLEIQTEGTEEAELLLSATCTNKMAHFAEIDQDSKVLRVIVVANKDTADENGNEVEQIGRDFCNRLLGGNWIQTSYNGNFRGKYAGIGDTYDSVLDIFVSPPVTNEEPINDPV